MSIESDAQRTARNDRVFILVHKRTCLHIGILHGGAAFLTLVIAGYFYHLFGYDHFMLLPAVLCVYFVVFGALFLNNYRDTKRHIELHPVPPPPPPPPVDRPAC